MPAKKGSPESYIMTMIKLPYYIFVQIPNELIWKFIFNPAHFIMWVIVAKVGDKKHTGTIWIIETKWIAKWVSYPIRYIKEFATMLTLHYGWPSIAKPGWRCVHCRADAKYWCIECGKKSCAQCSYNVHAPNMFAAFHSIEPIVMKANKQGIHLLSPIIPEIIAAGALYWLHGASEILKDDYMTTQQVCPAVNQLWSLTSTFDANLFYYYKNSFFHWCDVEDSYMRFILDFWVRTVVTETDNTILVFQTLPKAMLFEIVLAAIIAPVISFVCATVLTIVYFLESRIPRPKLPEGETTDANRPSCCGKVLLWFKKFVLALEQGAGKFHKYCQFPGSFLRSGDAPPFPPETLWRTRETSDFFDGLKYRINRVRRRFSYYFSSSLYAMKQLMWQSVVVTMILRLACMWFNLAPTIRELVSNIGLANMIQKHQAKYGSASNMFVTEPLLKESVGRALDVLPLFFVTVPKSLQALSFPLATVGVSFGAIIGVNIIIIHFVTVHRLEYFAPDNINRSLATGLDFKQDKPIQRFHGDIKPEDAPPAKISSVWAMCEKRSSPPNQKKKTEAPPAAGAA